LNHKYQQATHYCQASNSAIIKPFILEQKTGTSNFMSYFFMKQTESFTYLYIKLTTTRTCWATEVKEFSMYLLYFLARIYVCCLPVLNHFSWEQFTWPLVPGTRKGDFLKLECLAYKNHAKEFLKLYLKCPYGSDASSGLLQR
jgi:hypothetical protein